MGQRIVTCLWFDTQGEEAAELYCSLLPGSRITGTTPYPDGTDRAGSTMTVEFELDGRPYLALNGGDQFRFNEAVSFQVMCEDQAEVDRYWDALLADGGEEGPCGWLKDRFGLSWQVVPTMLPRLLGSSDAEQAARVNQAMYAMKKLDIATLEKAAG
jgi:predicted 3-demethylubiquinone-9 3-methyltransferase (glyoxalase superfamily)